MNVQTSPPFKVGDRVVLNREMRNFDALFKMTRDSREPDNIRTVTLCERALTSTGWTVQTLEVDDRDPSYVWADQRDSCWFKLAPASEST